jgi:WD40 repeat protein/serine/threonine protein kinase
MSADDLSATEVRLREVDTLCDRFEQALRRGEKVLVDDWLPPEGRLRDAALVELVRIEIDYRRRAGEAVTLEDYCARYPHLRAMLTGLPSIPGYEVIEELGRGGMGVVYKARQTSLDRIVALKMILLGPHSGPEGRARFRAEAEALARLRHPNVVQIHEIGEDAGGPFLALEFVEGGSLAQKLATSPLPAATAAALVETLARAVHVAHQQQIVHRDLKPANVLLQFSILDFGFSIEGGQPAAIENRKSKIENLIPKITDFGLVKRLDAVGQTQSGAVLGTPSYMAPEQAAGKTREVGPLADVYALGAILYECLTGRPPFRAASTLETLQQVLDDEPVAVRQLQPRCPRDLETICLKCLRKQSSGRYGTAQELAEDLRHFLDGKPVRARPISAGERALRWVRRRPAWAALLGVSVLALLAVVVASVAVYFNGELRIANQEAETQRHRAEEQQDIAEQQRTLARRYLYLSRINLAGRAWQQARVGLMEDLLRAELPTDGKEDFRRFEWHYLWRLRHAGPLTLRGHGHHVNAVAFDLDGRRLATASDDGTVKVWDAVTGREVLTVRGHAGNVSAVAFSPDGRRLASASGQNLDARRPGEVKLWDAASGRQLLNLIGYTGAVLSVAFSPNGSRLATASSDRTVRLWEADTGRPVHTLHGHDDQVTRVAFSPNGSRLASCSVDLTIKLWDANTGHQALTIRGHTPDFYAVAFSPDGSRLASASADREIRVWDTVTGRLVHTLHGHDSGVNSVAFSPDGKQLASASADCTVKVWDSSTGEEVFTLRGHANMVTSVVFSPDGRRLASSSWDHTAMIWDAGADRDAVTLRAPRSGFLNSVAFSPDGRFLAASGYNPLKRSFVPLFDVQMWDVESGREVRTFRGHREGVAAIAFSPAGRLLASASNDKTAKLWEVESGQELFTLAGHTHHVNHVAFSMDGRRLATASWDRTIKVWDTGTGRELLTLRGHADDVLGVAFSPDGRQLASASWDQTVRLWDATTGRELRALEGHTYPVNSVAFSPDGTRVASGSSDGSVRLWDAVSGRQQAVLKPHAYSGGLAFSPDSERLVTGGRHVTLWDLNTGQEVLTLMGHRLSAAGVAFSPDGKRLASCDYDGNVRIWDGRPFP